MRALMLLIDGLGDDKIPAWNNETPFAHAAHPAMDFLARQKNSVRAEFSICEKDFTPESCGCILRLLGVQKDFLPQNRAYLELLAHDRDISEHEMVLRCNLAAVDEYGKLAAFNGAGLTAQEMESAAQEIFDAEILREIEFLHLSEYRNLIILDKNAELLQCAIKPPHESVSENAVELLQNLRAKSLPLKYFLERAEDILAKYARNNLRYILYPWGSSERCVLPKFQTMHELRGGCVCKAEIVRGIAKALGMESCVPKTATGDIDTDIAAKKTAALELFTHNDFVLVHFNGTDEAAHRYDYAAKARLIGKIDAEFLAPFLQKFAAFNEALKIIICGDHVTSCVSGKHSRGAVPIIAAKFSAQECRNFADINNFSVTHNFSDTENTAAQKNLTLNNYRDIINFLMKESD